MTIREEIAFSIFFAIAMVMGWKLISSALDYVLGSDAAKGGRRWRGSGFVSEAPFFLIIVDEDRKQFAVEGPLTDHEPWSRAITAANDEGRKVRYCNIGEKTRADTIAVWQRHYGRFYRFIESGSALLLSR
jgi:hypothetical protein